MSPEQKIARPLAPWYKRGLACLAAIALGWIAWNFFGLKHCWLDMQHDQQLRRIDRHLKPLLSTWPAGSSSSTGTKAEYGRRQIIAAIYTARCNWPLQYRSNAVPEKVRAIAERLDATQGADLQTFEGCSRLLILFAGASRCFHNYPKVEELYQLEAEGLIPPLPPKPQLIPAAKNP